MVLAGSSVCTPLPYNAARCQCLQSFPISHLKIGHSIETQTRDPPMYARLVRVNPKPCSHMLVGHPGADSPCLARQQNDNIAEFPLGSCPHRSKPSAYI